MINKIKRKANKETKGITLIALVITIIVMLILAGVAISMSIDSNGLFGKANTAGESWNTAVENEQSELQDLLGTVDVVNVGWDINKIASTVTQTSTIAEITKERIVPIPKGYTVSGISTEATIAGGLVIYEIPEGATVDWTNKTITKDGTTSNLQETCNQYVWIPVDNINYMVMCKKNGSATKADGVTATEDGVTTCNLVLQNDGTLRCETHDSTDLCGRVYSTTSSNTTVDGKTVLTYAMSFTAEERATQTWDASDYREPDIMTGDSGTSYDGKDSYLTGIGFEATEDKTVQQVFLEQLTSDFTAMATSVAKYGGFYVSRYEAGVNGASKKNQKVLVAGTGGATNSNSDTYIGVNDKGTNNMWYGIYNTLRNNTGVDTSVVNTHMIWGSQYDQIINFLGTNPTNGPQIGHIDRQLATQVKTGSNEADVMSNIYDLEGNNYEWTVQADFASGRTSRGGYFCYVADGSNFYPASSRRYRHPGSTTCIFGSRLSLYIR